MKAFAAAAALLVGGMLYAEQPAPSSPAPPSSGAQTACPCCKMMQHQEAMGGRGMMGPEHAGQCPMMGQATVTIERTPNGAILRFTAKDPANVATVQQQAEMMSRCMGAAAPAQKK